MKTHTGIGASQGYVMGRVRKLKIPKAYVLTADLIQNPEYEIELFKSAIARSKADIEREKVDLAGKLSQEEADIFEAHISILEDPELVEQTIDEVRNSLVNAAFVFNRIAEGFQEQLLSLNDEYLSARAKDIEEVSKRVIAKLTQKDEDVEFVHDECILLCEELSTHQLAKVDHATVQAILTEEGGSTDHVAIICKALGIPLMVGVHNALEEIPDASLVIVDTEKGLIISDPTQDAILDFENRSKRLRDLKEDAFTRRHEVAKSKSSRSIKVFANVANLEEVTMAIDNGAEGIGLLRTELSFLQANSPPCEEEHFELYSKVMSIMKGKETVIRLMDFGTDKPLPYLPLPKEENPALGIRALRLGFKFYDSLLRPQIRALLRLSKNQKVQVLCPMISTAKDLKQIKEAFASEEQILVNQDQDFKSNIELGIMVEVPFVAIFPEDFVEDVDFFSFGTNDLAQFMMAADRSNSEVSGYLDAAKGGIIKLLENTVKIAHDRGKWVGICGEMASEPGLLETFLDLGVDEISMPSGLIPEVKEYIRRLD